MTLIALFYNLSAAAKFSQIPVLIFVLFFRLYTHRARDKERESDREKAGKSERLRKNWIFFDRPQQISHLKAYSYVLSAITTATEI